MKITRRSALKFLTALVAAPAAVAKAAPVPLRELTSNDVTRFNVDTDGTLSFAPPAPADLGQRLKASMYPISDKPEGIPYFGTIGMFEE